MPDWIAFACILIIQFIILILIEGFERYSNHPNRYDQTLLETTFCAIVGGLLFGAIFDLILGYRLSFFHYQLDGGLFHFLNALLSYGIALATALRFTSKPIQIVVLPPIRIFIFVLAIALIGYVFSVYFSEKFAYVWLTGAIIISLGEIIELVILKTKGPILEGIGGNYRRALRNWGISIFIGATYEIGNYIFPVWYWSMNMSGHTIIDVIIIIVFGYVVLLHSARVIGLLLLSAFRKFLSQSKANP